MLNGLPKKDWLRCDRVRSLPKAMMEGRPAPVDLPLASGHATLDESLSLSEPLCLHL